MSHCPHGGTGSAGHPDEVCQECHFERLFQGISDPQRNALKQIVFQNMILEALQLVKDELGIGLKEAIDFLYWLEPYLRKTNPGAFALPSDQYWSGFYS